MWACPDPEGDWYANPNASFPETMNREPVDTVDSAISSNAPSGLSDYVLVLG